MKKHFVLDTTQQNYEKQALILAKTMLTQTTYNYYILDSEKEYNNFLIGTAKRYFTAFVHNETMNITILYWIGLKPLELPITATPEEVAKMLIYASKLNSVIRNACNNKLSEFLL